MYSNNHLDKIKIFIAKFLLNFADPPYARVCIETRGLVFQKVVFKIDPPYARVCIETLPLSPSF